MTKSVDLVIVIDTSISMKDEAADLSQAALEAIEAAKSSCPCDLRVEWFGIEGRWKNTQFERRIRDYLLTECNVSESDIRARKRGELKGAGAQEDGARTIEDISNHFNWREGSAKAIFYLGDEALEGGGDQTTEQDIEAANQAIEAANAHEVIVHTYFGKSNSKYRDTLVSEYARLAAETEGQAFTDQDSLQGFQQLLETVICTSQIERSHTTEKDNTDNASDNAQQIDDLKQQATTGVESSQPQPTEAPSPETAVPVTIEESTEQSASNTTETETVKQSSTQQPPQSKILSIDGGGIRGIIPAMILAEIEKRTQQPIHRLFDLIAGTSTGGILALGLTKPSSKPDGKGQPTAQYSAEELVEMYVEYGGVIFYESLGGKILGPIEDIFIQPKFSSEAKEEVMTKYLGDTDLVECLKEVFVVSYDLEKRIPVLFTSNLAKQQTGPGQISKLCQGFTLKDAAMATSATPTYFKPYPVQASGNNNGCYSYTLVDGALVANNPAHLAMIEAGVTGGKTQNDTLLVSLGAGCLTSVYQYEDIENWGLLQWTIPLLNTIYDGSSKLVAGELERLLEPARLGQPGSYYRFQACLREELEALDNTLLQNIKGLQDSANLLIKQKTHEIDQLCEVLVSKVSCD